jgi:putative oxidoreductase
MFTRLFKTSDDRSLTFLRLLLAIVIFPHGAQKVLGWYGGYGLDGTLGYMTNNLGIPAIFAALAIIAEFLGPLGLALGLLTRVAAFGVLSVMTTAALLVHLPNGFFMNWSGQQAGEGFEYHLLAGAIALVLTIKGGGAYAVDQVVAERLEAPKGTAQLATH